ncbi:MAG: Asp-tRNA(Asn)/Glu-tRNA(Gln) amidotransferase subunit GatB [Candidatus Omnitrophota bacterium]|jgi:aspartyl-tRNA(Asn)/glutamyl-tRNA(Gln) amidotransferase subunit B
MNYDTVIGLEVHLHLNTKTKAFCSCSTEFGKEPNSQTCPVCLGFPGSLPVYNKTALDYAVKVALALNCTVQEYTKFDRKNYFYPDLPKNYQVSQYDLPLSVGGFLKINSEEKTKRIGITRVHMEEDAGKLIHKENVSLLDFNRAGIPLLEIVSEPDMNSPEEAYAYLAELKNILEYLDVSDCDMEKGSLRCDANISLKKEQSRQMGVKVELKNMNSFKAVKDALTFEVRRQAELLDEGKKIIQETRLWDAEVLVTVSMRTKEEAQDYRYFPEPDLPPFVIEKNKVEEIRNTLPELPANKLKRLIREYGLSHYDAKILISSRKDAEYAESCIKTYPGDDKKAVVNWLIGAVLSEANNRSSSIAGLNIPEENLISLIKLLQKQEISNLVAKLVLNEMINTGKPPLEIIKEKNLIQVSDSGELEKIVDEVVKTNQKSVADFKSGKENALMFLIGQAMKKSKGKANPKLLQEIFKRRLS